MEIRKELFPIPFQRAFIQLKIDLMEISRGLNLLESSHLEDEEGDRRITLRRYLKKNCSESGKLIHEYALFSLLINIVIYICTFIFPSFYPSFSPFFPFTLVLSVNIFNCPKQVFDNFNNFEKRHH
jgi:hypothetical protein